MSDELKLQKHNDGFYKKDNRLYCVWKTMILRCEDEKREKYPAYGGRGIKVCEEWHDVGTFFQWALENGYKHGLQIDRIDNNGNYCPENCHWVTAKENSRNRRNTKYLTLYGETKSVAEWCETIPISAYTIYWWISKFGKEHAENKIIERIGGSSWNSRV